MDVASLVRDLRKELGLTQDVLAQRCGFADRTRVALIECGRCKATSLAKRTALARGLGLSEMEFQGLLAGELDMATVARRIRARAKTKTATRAA